MCRLFDENKQPCTLCKHRNKSQIIDWTGNFFVQTFSVAYSFLVDRWYCGHTSFLYMLIRLLVSYRLKCLKNGYVYLQMMAKSFSQTVTSGGHKIKLQCSHWSCSNQISTLGVAFAPHIALTAQAAEVNQRISLPTADSVAIFVVKINNATETCWHLGCTAFVWRKKGHLGQDPDSFNRVMTTSLVTWAAVSVR